MNPAGEPLFVTDPNTQSVNNLSSAELLNNNPNSANHFRFGRSQAVTCDMNHNYTFEQKEYNGGLTGLYILVDHHLITLLIHVTQSKL
jgi:phospholipase C